MGHGLLTLPLKLLLTCTLGDGQTPTHSYTTVDALVEHHVRMSCVRPGMVAYSCSPSCIGGEGRMTWSNAHPCQKCENQCEKYTKSERAWSMA
jgi:hypothetical protein